MYLFLTSLKYCSLVCFLTATKSHKCVQAMTYAQAELLVNVDAEYRSNSLPSGVQPPEGKKKGKCDKSLSQFSLGKPNLAC